MPPTEPEDDPGDLLPEPEPEPMPDMPGGGGLNPPPMSDDEDDDDDDGEDARSGSTYPTSQLFHTYLVTWLDEV